VALESNRSILRVIIVFVVIIAFFWVLIMNILQPESPEIVYLNETSIVVDDTIKVEHNNYTRIPLDVKEGDVIYYTIGVLEGNRIDFFILEEDRVEMLIDALEGKSNRFESYERGRGVNITSKNSEFIITNNKNWYLFINNYGHIHNGAIPVSDVRVEVRVEKIGLADSDGFSNPS
jgi:hypothetical protein